MLKNILLLVLIAGILVIDFAYADWFDNYIEYKYSPNLGKITIFERLRHR